MAAKKIKSNLRNENGQALFELIVFLPLMIFMLTIIYTIGNSINASINQVKATRRYFYYISKGNSRLPDKSDLQKFLAAGMLQPSMSSVAWTESRDGEKSYSACYKINTLFGADTDDDCKEPKIEEEKTQFIRIFTAYGVCGEEFLRNNEIAAYERNAENPVNCFVK